MKDYDKNENLSYIQYWGVNNLYGWEMSQNLSVNNFEWIKDTSQFNEDFIKKINEESNEVHFSKLMIKSINRKTKSIFRFFN